MPLQVSNLYLDNDLDLLLTGVQKADTLAYFDGTATVTFSIDSTAGVNVTSGSLAYVALSSGDFRAKVEKAALTSLVAGGRYRILATAIQDGYDGEWTLTLTARVRGRN